LKGEKGGTFMVRPRRHLASLRHWQSESMTSSIWHLTNLCAWHLPLMLSISLDRMYEATFFKFLVWPAMESNLVYQLWWRLFSQLQKSAGFAWSSVTQIYVKTSSRILGSFWCIRTEIYLETLKKYHAFRDGFVQNVADYPNGDSTTGIWRMWPLCWFSSSKSSTNCSSKCIC